MADNKREELENEISLLSNEDLDKVAGGELRAPANLFNDTESGEFCAKLAALFGENNKLYQRMCIK